MTPRMKISSDGHKKTLPYNKQVYRRIADGRIIGDTIDRYGSGAYQGALEMLKPIIINGSLVYDFPLLLR